VAGITAGAIAMVIATPVMADDVSELRAEIRALSKRLADMEKAGQDGADGAGKGSAAAAAPGGPTKNAVQETPAALRTDNSGNVLGFLQKPVTLYQDSNTSLHMYGIIEATLSAQSNQPNANGTNKPAWAYGYQTAWFSGNRLGFDADHALAGGGQFGFPDLKIIAKMETEFESPTGDMDTPGVLFNRDAWVGFQSADLGKLTFGRQNTVTRDFTQTWGDPYGTPYVTLKEGGYSNVNNFKQIIFYSASSTLTRNDSGIVWKKSFFDDHVVLGPRLLLRITRGWRQRQRRHWKQRAAGWRRRQPRRFPGRLQ
jgi:Gram-negative porin